jgi:FkbM family methyltransferase
MYIIYELGRGIFKQKRGSGVIKIILLSIFKEIHMTFVVRSVFLILFTFILNLEAKNPVYKFEGILGSVSENITNRNDLAPGFLPYNPIVVEIGSFEGLGTLSLSNSYPYGLIFAFEPNPRAYDKLIEATKFCKNVIPLNLAVNTFNGHANFYLCHGVNNDDLMQEYKSSLLPNLNKPKNPLKGPTIDVPCVMLDDWCKKNNIDHIDFLRLDAGGMELQILKSSPKILDTIIVLVTKTNFYPFRTGTTLFPSLRKFLEKNGFEMLAHWYREGDQGEAIFVRKTYYDALFR